jgi:hypothetical protein
MLASSFFAPELVELLRRGFETNPEATMKMLDTHRVAVVEETEQNHGYGAALQRGAELRAEVRRLREIFTRNQPQTATRSMASPSPQSWKQSADFLNLSWFARSHVEAVAKHSPGNIPALIRSMHKQGHGRRR